MKPKQFIITKKVAKHGNQAVIVIPRILESQLKPGTIAKFTIDVIEEDDRE
jgi:antitoxin component of MazEF toxin-antitoxin module